MSDIFISYKREDQAAARHLANALESEGWTVWWDPKLRAGERFNDVIEKALKESKCVVVMWSERSVESKYVKDEATYALNRNKLVPVMIEAVELPFRFEGLHTPTLLDWDGSKDSSEFQKLVQDIAAIVGPPATEAKQKANEETERNRPQQEPRESVQNGQSVPSQSDPWVRVTYKPGSMSSRSGASRDQIECEWKGVLIRYNGSPHDLFDLSLELAPNRIELPLEKPEDTNLKSGARIRLRVDMKREYPRMIVEAAGHNRFVQLLPEELASFQCRVVYKNAAGCRFYSLYRKTHNEQQCTFHRCKPRWAAA